MSLESKEHFHGSSQFRVREWLVYRHQGRGRGLSKMEVVHTADPKTLDTLSATFTLSEQTTFTHVDVLSFELVGQEVQAQAAVLDPRGVASST